MTGYQPFHSGKWQGFSEGFFPENLDQWLANANSSPRRSLPSRILTSTDINGTRCYLKTLLGLGETPKDFFKAMKWRLRTSRAMAVFRISTQLEDAGFHCAHILLAATKRSWKPFGWPTELIITTEAAGQSILQLFRSPDLHPDAKSQILDFTAKELARFHQAGFIHGDCIPGNLFYAPAPERLTFIDNDRTVHKPFLRTYHQCRNLFQFASRAIQSGILSRDEVNDFLNRYADAAGWTQNKRLSKFAWVWKRVEERLLVEPPKPLTPR